MELQTKEPLMIGVKSIRDGLQESLNKSKEYPEEFSVSKIKQRLYVAAYLEHRIENLIDLFTQMIEENE